MTMEELREKYARFCEENEDLELVELHLQFCNQYATSIEEWFYLMDLLTD